MDKAEGVQAVLAVMEKYSLTQEDVDTILDITKFEGHPDPLEGVPPPVKAALTKGFSQALQARRVKTADLLPSIFPGQKKISKKKARLITPEDVEGEELPKDTAEEEDEGESNGDEQTEEQSDEAGEKEKDLEALKNSKAGYEITVAGETKSKGGKRTTAPKTKQKPTQSQGASSSKGTKRKR